MINEPKLELCVLRFLLFPELMALSCQLGTVLVSVLPFSQDRSQISYPRSQILDSDLRSLIWDPRSQVPDPRF